MPKRVFEFGPFRIDTAERLLLRHGEPVPVTPKAFDVLFALVENHGKTVTTDELIERVWADTFVEAGNLNRNISTLRSLLGDDRREPRFIKTFPKRGYRFEAEVREVIEDEEPLVVEHRTNYRVAVREVTTQTTPSYRRPAVIGAVAVAAMLLLGLAWNFAGRASESDKRPAVIATQNPQALDLYQRGRALWQDRRGGSLHEATLLLEQAVAADPNFALAHAALADAYAFDRQERLKAVETARRAIELDPQLGQPHATIGFVRMFWDWKLVEAESHLKRAVTLSPDYATAHQWYALALVTSGQGNEALSEMKKALELEPASLAINADLCQVLYFMRRFDDAETQCKATLAIDASFLNAHLYLYEIYMGKEMYDEALARFARVEELSPSYYVLPGHHEQLQRAYREGGIRGFWRKRADLLEKTPLSDYRVALYKARLGERDAALAWLKKAYEKHDLDFMYFYAEPVFAQCCYPDPRYTDLQMRLIDRDPRN